MRCLRANFQPGIVVAAASADRSHRGACLFVLDLWPGLYSVRQYAIPPSASTISFRPATEHHCARTLSSSWSSITATGSTPVARPTSLSLAISSATPLSLIVPHSTGRYPSIFLLVRNDVAGTRWLLNWIMGYRREKHLTINIILQVLLQ